MDRIKNSLSPRRGTKGVTSTADAVRRKKRGGGGGKERKEEKGKERRGEEVGRPRTRKTGPVLRALEG